MKNLNLIHKMVRTQYNDVEGLISVDFHEMNYLYKLCGDHEIEIDKYFPFGFGIIDVNNNSDIIMCQVLLLEKEKYGKSFDEISSSLKTLKSVDVIKKSFTIEYKELFKYVKRIDFMCVSEIGNYINSMNIISDN